MGPARAQGLLLLMVGIWALNFSVTKDALATVPPLAFNALRFPLAAAVILVALRAHGRLRLPDPGDRLRVLALGVLGNMLYQLFFILGISRTRAGTASVLLAGTPVLTALFSAWNGHERIDASTWVGLVAASAGIALVVPPANTAGSGTLLGAAFLIGASFAWAAYTVGSRNFVRAYGALNMTAWTLTIGAIGLVLLGLPDVFRLDFSTLGLDEWLAIAYAGALSIGAAYLIWYAAVAVLGNTRTAAFSNLVPALALLIAWLWLDEVPSVRQLVGAAIVLGGVALTQFGSVRRRPPALP